MARDFDGRPRIEAAVKGNQAGVPMSVGEYKKIINGGMVSARADLLARERIFAEIYLGSGDELGALEGSGLVVPPNTRPEDFAKSVLGRQNVQDYLVLMGDSGSDDLEQSIRRLEAMRRGFLRDQDFKGALDVEGRIAKMRGWDIDRSESSVRRLSMNINSGSLPAGQNPVMGLSSGDIYKLLEGLSPEQRERFGADKLGITSPAAVPFDRSGDRPMITVNSEGED